MDWLWMILIYMDSISILRSESRKRQQLPSIANVSKKDKEDFDDSRHSGEVPSGWVCPKMMSVQIYGLLWRKKWREAQGVACYACSACSEFSDPFRPFVKAGWWTTPKWRSDCNWVATVSNDFIACSLTSKNWHSQTKTISYRIGADLQRSRRKPNPYKIYQILVSLCFP